MLLTWAVLEVIGCDSQTVLAAAGLEIIACDVFADLGQG